MRYQWEAANQGFKKSLIKRGQSIHLVLRVRMVKRVSSMSSDYLLKLRAKMLRGKSKYITHMIKKINK